MRKFSFLLSILVLGFLTACQTNLSNSDHSLAVGEQHHLHNGDIQEATASVQELPKFLDHQPEEIRIIYQAAALNHDLLQWIPCYCGCGRSAGHLNNSNCFYKEIREDGSIVWDDHATRCNACLEIAAFSIQKKNQGLSTLEIREWIDDQYGEGYAEPTPTPMPEA